jgi:DNA-binding MarR family transcriptional regulator
MSDQTPCVCGRLRRASRALTRHYDEALAPVGLTITQFSVMRTLSTMDRPTLVELSDRTAHEKSALWRTLQPLIRQGWVAAEPGRAQHFALTGLGHERLELARPLWQVAQASVSQTLGPREAALIALLQEIETHV